MLDCMVLGDSLAVGVGQARPACVTVARVGIGSGAWAAEMLPGLPREAGRAVISLGVNDGAGVDTAATLRRVRAAVRAGRVTWLLPATRPDVRRAIGAVAAAYGDAVVDTAGEAGPDGLHPGKDGYRRVAERIEGAPVRGTVPGAVPVEVAAAPAVPEALRRPGAAAGPKVVPMVAPVRLGGLPMVLTPGGAYAAWPPPGVAFAAIPPGSYAYGAVPSLPRR